MTQHAEHAAAIRDAVVGLLARDGCAGGDPAYYGLDVINLSNNTVCFDLVLTFRSEHACCCQEPGRHLAPFYRKFWEAIRETIKDCGLRQPPPMRLVHVHTVVEPGAIFRTHTDMNLPSESPAFDVQRSAGWAEADATG